MSEVAPLKKYQAVLVLIVAAIGFLFDTYELLMFPVIGSDAVAELLKVTPADPVVRLWAGRMLWIAAVCGGVFGLLGGWLVDRLGRKTVMVGSIFLYSFSPVCASFSTELWQLIVFRCTTFVGVCVELVAAVTWLAELFPDKRKREMAIAWTLACASLGGIFVTEVYNGIVEMLKNNPEALPAIPVPEGLQGRAAWRYTLLTGLIPGGLILLLLPFVPESRVWREKKLNGTLKRPSFGELFSPGLSRTTIVTTILSACGYAAAFGALQLTPLQIAPGLPDIVEKRAPLDQELKEAQKKVKEAEGTALEAEAKKALGPINKKMADFRRTVESPRRGDIQRWQELGGLTGRILLAILVTLVPSRVLLRIFVFPGIILFPLAYLFFVNQPYVQFAIMIFLCGLLTVAQFSYLSELLPKLFPLHLRGTGAAFATNIGGRMIGTMAAVLNTELLSAMMPGDSAPLKVATAAAVIGGTVYGIAFICSFLLPDTKQEHAS